MSLSGRLCGGPLLSRGSLGILVAKKARLFQQRPLKQVNISDGATGMLIETAELELNSAISFQALDEDY